MADRVNRSLASLRHQQIAELVVERGEVRVTELASALGTSAMTVRRDLDLLAAAGLLMRVHGGATVRRDRAAAEPAFGSKRHRNIAEKQAIAERCAARILPGLAIGITAGTTTLEVARAIQATPDLTVVTNSLAVADLLHDFAQPTTTVILTGGERTPSNALVGPTAIATLRSFHLDITIMGVHGMDERHGFTTPNLVEAETNRCFVDASDQVIVVADHTKWNIVGLTTILPLAQVDTLISDDQLASDAQLLVADAGPTLTLATL